MFYMSPKATWCPHKVSVVLRIPSLQLWWELELPPAPPSCPQLWLFHPILLSNDYSGTQNAQTLGRHVPAPPPCEVLKSAEGHHDSHPLARGGKATVHEELGAVPGQVRVGDADRDGHPAMGSKCQLWGRHRVGPQLPQGTLARRGLILLHCQRDSTVAAPASHGRDDTNSTAL